MINDNAQEFLKRLTFQEQAQYQARTCYNRYKTLHLKKKNEFQKQWSIFKVLLGNKHSKMKGNMGTVLLQIK